MARRGGLRSVAVMLAAGALLVGLGPTGVAAAAPPPNDKRADATVVGSLPFSDSVDVSGATRAASDPGACYNDILARWARTMHRTIWYRIPAPGADTLIVRVVASAGRPVLVAGRLISGRLVGDCQYTGRRDATGYMSYIDPGADAYVVIGLADDVPATLDVAIESGAAHDASNDAWQDATPIEQTPFVDRVDLSTATGSADDPPACGGSQHTIWYRIRPAHRMRLEVSTSGVAPSVLDPPAHIGLIRDVCAACSPMRRPPTSSGRSPGASRRTSSSGSRRRAIGRSPGSVTLTIPNDPVTPTPPWAVSGTGTRAHRCRRRPRSNQGARPHRTARRRCRSWW